MIKKRMEDALNGQINAEFYSSYLYLSMSAYFDSIDLKGFSQWMNAQAQEEIMHAMKMYTFIQERGGTVTLGPICRSTHEMGIPAGTLRSRLQT